MYIYIMHLIIVFTLCVSSEFIYTLWPSFVKQTYDRENWAKKLWPFPHKTLINMDVSGGYDLTNSNQMLHCKYDNRWAH